ncbi:unnamed protein product [Ambrosiozyma monospora]|uniref:Unnamed protein product n=1 Tax=Ambrosiozyma monospora TaxID=43982 RepID=A0ACB5TS89_AMBMO|nr:unnamed protein product [Ambrosiozyma monospora]
MILRQMKLSLVDVTESQKQKSFKPNGPDQFQEPPHKIWFEYFDISLLPASIVSNVIARGSWTSRGNRKEGGVGILTAFNSKLKQPIQYLKQQNKPRVSRGDDVNDKVGKSSDLLKLSSKIMIIIGLCTLEKMISARTQGKALTNDVISLICGQIITSSTNHEKLLEKKQQDQEF